MAARITIERILRDDDDDAGQSVRGWKIEADSGFLNVRSMSGAAFILLRAADVRLFALDLAFAKTWLENLSGESNGGGKERIV